MTTVDQQFSQPSAGQADWDTSLLVNITIAERGYHTTARVGYACNTAHVLWLDSNGFFQKFDPNSANIEPHALAIYAASSGDSIQALRVGVVRSLFAADPGKDYFVSAATPGLIAASYSAANRRVGIGMADGGFLFWPRGFQSETLTKATTVTINPTSTHLFTLDIGKQGWVRDLLLKSNSADKVGLAFYSNSARDNLMYQTRSGGVTTATSFIDRAGWPYENTDASTLSGILYGKVWPDSGAAIASQDLQIRVVADRRQ